MHSFFALRSKLFIKRRMKLVKRYLWIKLLLFSYNLLLVFVVVCIALCSVLRPCIGIYIIHHFSHGAVYIWFQLLNCYLQALWQLELSQIYNDCTIHLYVPFWSTCLCSTFLGCSQYLYFLWVEYVVCFFVLSLVFVFVVLGRIFRCYPLILCHPFWILNNLICGSYRTLLKIHIPKSPNPSKMTDRHQSNRKP